MGNRNSLKHAGVKGMKWGIRRDYNRPGGADGKPDAKDKPIRTSLGRKLNSLKRERQWKSVLKEMDNLSSKDIGEVTKRIKLENSLKKLSRSPVATKKDKEDYLRRERMDNQELARKVARLTVKENLHKAVLDASAEQRAFGERLVNIGKSVGIRYVLNKKLGADYPLGTDYLMDVLKDPKASADKAKGDAKKELGKRGRDILNEVMKKQSKP